MFDLKEKPHLYPRQIVKGIGSKYTNYLTFIVLAIILGILTGDRV